MGSSSFCQRGSGSCIRNKSRRWGITIINHLAKGRVIAKTSGRCDHRKVSQGVIGDHLALIAIKQDCCIAANEKAIAFGILATKSNLLRTKQSNRTIRNIKNLWNSDIKMVTRVIAETVDRHSNTCNVETRSNAFQFNIFGLDEPDNKITLLICN